MKEQFKGKTVLVIGGTGTIGRRIVETLMQWEPAVIRILSRDEGKQFEMAHELDDEDLLRFFIGDVRDKERVERACRGADIVFHLAAMKHVPACEYDTYDALKTNVMGTQNVICAAFQNHVKRVVFTSTDKAISPTNVMGATKLLAERLIATANYNQGPTDTAFSSVRFGNVMGSRGSVIPLFKSQILRQRKVTITDGDMTRFMMSISDAAMLTLKAATMPKGGEIFVLKMPVVRLRDLVDVVVEETCLKYGVPVGEVRREEIGLRFGEKMFEELMTVEESKFGFELPEMYAICQAYFAFWGKKGISPLAGLPAAEVRSYSSQDQEPIDKEAVRRIILAEKLI
jgi:FlaA1/EpsC-like NDP-sugar epimerase